MDEEDGKDRGLGGEKDLTLGNVRRHLLGGDVGAEMGKVYRSLTGKSLFPYSTSLCFQHPWYWPKHLNFIASINANRISSKSKDS